MDILRGNVFEVNLIYSGAVFRVVRHAEWRNDIRQRKIQGAPAIPQRGRIPLKIDGSKPCFSAGCLLP